MSAQTFNAAWLMSQEFEPIKYVVPGVIPEGMTLVVAAPKIGKSWLALGVALGLSGGGMVLGHLPVGKPRPVLYLALEDGPRRLQDRLKHLGGYDATHRLEFIVNMGGDSVVQTIREYMAKYDGLDPVVILDTLGKVMPANNNGSQYQHDYQMLSALKATCDAVPGSSLLIVHHTRKHEASDFLDAVSGTQGIAGAADTVLLLSRERHDDTATLQVTSRDAAEGEYRLRLTDVGKWEIEGATLEDAAHAAQTARATAGVGDHMAELIAVIAAHPNGVSTKDVTDALPEIRNVREYLRRALEAGRIRKLARGLYGPCDNRDFVTLPDHESHTVTNVTGGDDLIAAARIAWGFGENS